MKLDLGARRRRARELDRKAYYAFPPRERGIRVRMVVAAYVARLVLLGLVVGAVGVATGVIR